MIDIRKIENPVCDVDSLLSELKEKFGNVNDNTGFILNGEWLSLHVIYEMICDNTFSADELKE